MKLGVVEDSQRGNEYVSDILLSSIICIVFIIRKFIIISL